jgi:hypothetical protein
MDKIMKVHAEWHDIRIRHIRVRKRTRCNSSSVFTGLITGRNNLYFFIISMMMALSIHNTHRGMNVDHGINVDQLSKPRKKGK